MKNKESQALPEASPSTHEKSATQFQGTILLDADLKMTFVSPSLLSLSGYSEDMVVNRHPFQFLAPGEAGYVYSELQQLSRLQGGTKELVLRSRQFDGRWLIQSVSISNLLHVEGVRSLVCQFSEVSKEVQICNELAASESFYRTIFVQNPLPIAICSQSHLRILEVNDKMMDMFGYDREELLTMFLKQFEYVQSKKAVSLLEESYRVGNFSRKEISLVTKNGDPLVCELTATKLQFRAQAAYLVVINNISPVIELQNALTQEKVERQKLIARATLDGQEKQSRELSMELHDSINPVLASVKLLLEYGLSVPAELPRLVERSVSHIEKVIEENRRLSKNLAPPAMEHSGLADAVLEIVQSLRIVTKLSVEPHILLGGEELINEGLKICVFRVIQEQVNNVIKYASATRLIIGLVQTTHSLELVIEDNGVGFDSKAKRTGIGLNNIFNRAEMFNGKVELNTERQRGCRLLIRFPL